MFRICIVALAGLLFSPVVAAQGVTPTTGSGGQTSVQANPSLGSGGLISPAGGRSVYVSGKVVMQDSSPVPQNVVVQRVCGGAPKTVAYTDAKGRFSFRWGDANNVISDAADAGSGSGRNASTAGFGSSQSAGAANPLASDPFGNRMMNCSLRASLAGFGSSDVNLFGHSSAENPNVGTILLHRIAGVEGSSISVTSMAAPKEARKAYDRGLQSELKNKLGDAERDFKRAVAIYPNYADAWFSLGKLLIQQQAIEPARAALMKAAESDPKLVESYIELGLLAARDANWSASVQFLDKAVKLDPVDYPQAWYADAVANFNLSSYEAAEHSAREAVKLDPKHVNPRSEYLLGLVLFEKRDYPGAKAELSEYIKLAPGAPDVEQARRKLESIR